ncbi:MAG: GNAT family N-acetyltransferase [Pseudomonadota bacterium]|jgi:GNAT superfamily N-acetyltransferase
MLNGELRVRRLTAVDAAALSGLCAEHAAYEGATTPPAGHAVALASWLRSQRIVAFGAADAIGVLRGYASLTVEVSTLRAAAFAHLDCLYLSEAFRGAGHGRLLMKAVRDHARCAGLAVMEWQTPAWNAPAQRFYERQGATGSVKLRYFMAL